MHPHRLLACLGAIVCLAATTASAQAAKLYWGDQSAGTIAFANPDGTGVGALDTDSTGVERPFGTAIDAAAGRVYWIDPAGEIAFAKLDGSGGRGRLSTTGATMRGPLGLAIDPVARQIFWANSQADTISWANLDGSGGGDLDTGAATVDTPTSVLFDPEQQKLFWTNSDSIAFARLDGTGGEDLDTAGASVLNPMGLAIDPLTQRIYWASFDGIASANADGSGFAADLDTGAATVARPMGLTIDVDGGLVYWANNPGRAKISFAALDGPPLGGDLVSTPGDTGAAFPVLHREPAPAALPVVTGATTTGSTLSCSEGRWQGDLPQAFSYRAARSFAYEWTRDGATLPGATERTLTADAAGSYSCRVIARNDEGTARQTSLPHAVTAAVEPRPQPRPGVPVPPAVPGGGTPPPPPAAPAAFGAGPRVTIALVPGGVAARGPVTLRIANANAFAIGGGLAAVASVPGGRRVRLASRRLALAPNSRRTVALKLPRALQRLLAQRRVLGLRLTLTLVDPAGGRRVVRQTVKPRLRRRAAGSRAYAYAYGAHSASS